MGSSMDFMEVVGVDISLMIFKLLNDPADLVRATAVSGDWKDFVIEHGLGKELALKKYPQLSGVALVTLVNQMDFPDESGSNSSMECENKKRDHIVFTLLVHLLESLMKGSCIVEAISASSTDNYPRESITNTLIPSDRIEQMPCYWSSRGQRNPYTSEELIYKLKSSMCLISEFYIKPFKAYFQFGYPTYPAKFVRFKMGHPKPPFDFDLEHVQLDELTVHNFVWTYTSPKFPMSEDNSLQKFQLPKPALCIGGFLLVELLGRVQTQEMDDLYYICVSHVCAVGMSLSPKFSVKTLENSANLVLECNPHALIDVPVDTPVETRYIPGFQIHHAEEGDDAVEEEFYDDDLFPDEEFYDDYLFPDEEEDEEII